MLTGKGIHIFRISVVFILGGMIRSILLDCLYDVGKLGLYVFGGNLLLDYGFKVGVIHGIGHFFLFPDVIINERSIGIGRPQSLSAVIKGSVFVKRKLGKFIGLVCIDSLNGRLLICYLLILSSDLGLLVGNLLLLCSDLGLVIVYLLFVAGLISIGGGFCKLVLVLGQHFL